MTERFAPQIIVPGYGTYTPTGWQWQLGFALGGCQWAIEICSTEEWRQIVRDWYRERKIESYETELAYYESRVDRLRKELGLLRGK